MSKVKVGLIGAGGIAVEHIKGYLANKDCEVYAICDINESLAKKRAEEYNIPNVFTNADDMLALPELDAVSICVLNALHAGGFDLGKAEGGVHILELSQQVLADLHLSGENVAHTLDGLFDKHGLINIKIIL